MVQQSAAHVPWMYAIGNHDVENDLIPYTTRYYQPSSSDSPHYYSYEVSGAHVISLSVYTPYDANSSQMAWLEEDLESVNRTKTPWLIVMMHAPWYNSNKEHRKDALDMQTTVEPLLFYHNVDIVFTGHVHAYERNEPVYQNEPNECAPIYITIGDGGNSGGVDKKWKDQPEYSVWRESSFGHGILDLWDATHARWSWKRNKDAISAPTIPGRDEIAIERKRCAV